MARLYNTVLTRRSPTVRIQGSKTLHVSVQWCSATSLYTTAYGTGRNHEWTKVLEDLEVFESWSVVAWVIIARTAFHSTGTHTHYG
eukprot:5359726-Amphidinium_carterae.1